MKRYLIFYFKFVLVIYLILLGILVTSSFAKVFYKKEQALKIAFPKASKIERKTIFLTEVQVKKIQNLAKAKVESKMIVYYLGKLNNKILGYCFFETNIVRTMPATLMIVLNSSGNIKFVEILAFYEPLDYLPKKNWLSLFNNKSLINNLYVKKGIKNISGATLTANSISTNVRKILALFEVVIKGNKK